MGTEKRERQKANRARREQELAKQAARARTTRIGVIVAAAIVAVFALVFIAGQFVGDDDEQDPIAPVDSVLDEPTDQPADGPTDEPAENDETTDTVEVVE